MSLADAAGWRVRFGQVRQFEAIPRDGVAQIAHAEKAMFDDAVDQFLDHFVARHLLGDVARLQADLVQGGADDRPQTLAQTMLAADAPTR